MLKFKTKTLMCKIEHRYQETGIKILRTDRRIWYFEKVIQMQIGHTSPTLPLTNDFDTFNRDE